jgi:hypothetical protein
MNVLHPRLGIHSTHGLRLAVLALACALLFAAPALAEEDYGDYDEGGAERFGLGLGVGLVDTDLGTEPYFTAGLRIRLGGDDRYERTQAGILGYLEPEIGYWEGDNNTSDLLVGVNLIGVVPFRRVDYHFGVGAGVHFLDTAEVDATGVTLAEDIEEKFGLNGQFGIDIELTEAASLFGTGRFDLVEGTEDDLQEKLYIGVRFHF